jgi:hypothetical protein
MGWAFCFVLFCFVWHVSFIDILFFWGFFWRERRRRRRRKGEEGQEKGQGENVKLDVWDLGGVK